WWARAGVTDGAATGGQGCGWRGMRAATLGAVVPAAVLAAGALAAAALAAAVLAAAAVRGVVAVAGAVAGRHNEAKPNCSPGFDSKMMMNQKLRRRSRGPVTTFE